ncbi:MAG: hypothetical protein QXY97_02545, partial [Acidilobaceae archaeon]
PPSGFSQALPPIQLPPIIFLPCLSVVFQLFGRAGTMALIPFLRILLYMMFPLDGLVARSIPTAKSDIVLLAINYY